MSQTLQKGHLRARVAETAGDLREAQALRTLCFGRDASDALDADCTHVLIEDTVHDSLVCCYRMLRLNGAQVPRSYSAQFYGLSGLQSFDGEMIELGRFCIHPGHTRDPDVLRLAWGVMTAYVDTHDIGMLFGCSSYAGTDASPYLDSFDMLAARHLAPARWRPDVIAPQVYRFASRARPLPDLKAALRATPPLLRTYLSMGGWVSDHAVVDARMNTLHVFTGVEIRAIPDARKRLLRAVAR